MICSLHKLLFFCSLRTAVEYGDHFAVFVHIGSTVLTIISDRHKMLLSENLAISLFQQSIDNSKTE